MDKVYRIYTEDVDRNAVIRMVAKQFESFTVHETVGYYRGKAEDSIVIEIVDAKAAPVRALAKKIRLLTGQNSVLVINLSGQAKKIQTKHES
ncbi:MAG: hypothetical protein GZ088_05865 [Acidipila sp.]|nr:hypothetical protein [Acidipila sp.]